jgi:MerR family copper efflux transcriptional regulator
MHIGTLAEMTGLSRDTLRFYEQRGLIRSTRSANGYRLYAAETVHLLGYIRIAQRLGFTLGQIGESLPALLNSAMPQLEVNALLAEKVAAIDRKIDDLTGLKNELLKMMGQVCPNQS